MSDAHAFVTQCPVSSSLSLPRVSRSLLSPLSGNASSCRSWPSWLRVPAHICRALYCSHAPSSDTLLCSCPFSCSHRSTQSGSLPLQTTYHLNKSLVELALLVLIRDLRVVHDHSCILKLRVLVYKCLLLSGSNQRGQVTMSCKPLFLDRNTCNSSI